MASEQETLTERLSRYPVARYPVQHATTQFHLGTVLLHTGDVSAALNALTTARAVFDGAGMRVERAKSTNMLGVALRSAGRPAEACDAFREAAAEFEALSQPVENAAASYNLGLAHADSGDRERAHAAWSRAAELFLAAGHPAQAASSVRDHGASLLTTGDVAAARPLLEQATELAERGGDLPGLGAAANALGLTHLAAGDAAAAVAAYRHALGAFPRSVRPAEYAMAKANLALAHEQAGQEARARLTARQALAVSGAAAPVRSQAREVLDRLPAGSNQDLPTALDAEPPDRWISVFREEALRLDEASVAERRHVLRGVLDCLLTRPGTCYDIAASLLHVLLELPPRRYEDMVVAVVAATNEMAAEDARRVRAVVGSALARFPVPQWQRLVASFNHAATTAGQEGEWR